MLAPSYARPAIYQYRLFAVADGLIAYGPSPHRFLSPNRRLCWSCSQGREVRRADRVTALLNEVRLVVTEVAAPRIEVRRVGRGGFAHAEFFGFDPDVWPLVSAEPVKQRFRLCSCVPARVRAYLYQLRVGS
jgi:hypothetical protein